MRLAGSELTLDHQDTGPVGEATVVFGQKIGALPVFDSVLALFIDSAGVVREIRSQLVPAPALVLPQATLTEAQAIQRAEAQLVARGIVPQTTPFALSGVHDLSVSNFRADLAVAWMVRYPGEVSVFIDAGTGELRELRSEQSSDFFMHVAQFVGTERTYPPAIQPDGSENTTRLRTTPSIGTEPDGPVEDNGCSFDPSDPAADDRCLIAVGNLVRADHFYRTVWGRDGFSDGKASRLGEYALMYGEKFTAESNLSCYPGAIDRPGCDSSTRRRVAVGDGGFHADVITHEFGHGFLWDPAIRVRTLDEGGALTPQAYLGEHVADLIVALTQLSISGGTPEEAFRNSMADGHAVRDSTIFGCEGYHLPPPGPGEPLGCDTDDVNLLEAPNNPQPLGCREYVHLDFLANLDAPGEKHANSCMYSHVGYLLAQQGAVPSVRGVPTPGGISRELLAHFYRKLFSAPHQSPRSDDYWDYGSAFRTVVGIVVGNCASGLLPGIPECDELSALGAAERITRARELSEQFTAALWAEGFWSDPDLLSWRSDIAPVAVSAPAVGSPGSALHVFYAFADMLQMVSYGDPTDAGRTQSGPFDLSALAGASVRTTGPLAVTTDLSGGIHLAYVDSTSAQVRLLRRDAAGTWTTASLPFSTAAETGLAISVLPDGRELLVAGTAGRLEYYFDDSVMVEGIVRSGFGAMASQPSLTSLSTATGSVPILAFVSPDAAPTMPRGRLEFQLFNPTSLSFERGDQLRVLSSPGRVRVPFSLESRFAPTPENLDGRMCPGGIGDCKDFIGTRCVGFLGATCQVEACVRDADCSGVVGALGEAHVPCVDGTCASFARSPITASDLGTGPTLVPFVDSGSSRRLHVFVRSSRKNDRSDPGGLTFADLVPTDSGASVAFDEFHASRQVRLADDASFATGYAAAAFDDSAGRRIDVVLGVDASRQVRLIWRRSE